jgi:hypothetical protein
MLGEQRLQFAFTRVTSIGRATPSLTSRTEQDGLVHGHFLSSHCDVLATPAHPLNLRDRLFSRLCRKTIASSPNAVPMSARPSNTRARVSDIGTWMQRPSSR